MQGIYGNRQGAEVHRPYECNICGTSLPSTINSGSCRACYWVLTRQLVRRLVARFGRWSEIHDSIFCFLTEPHFILENDPRFHARFRARFRVDVLAEVRQHGLLQGSAEPLPGVRLRRREVGMEGQRRFAKRYRLGDVDWIPPSGQHEHVLVWHPPMVPPPWEAFARVADELARQARHSLAGAISSRCTRALFVVEQAEIFPGRAYRYLYAAPCNWCGHFTELSCDGVPASSTSRGWLCEFRVCFLCQRLYERCRQCCRWTGLPARAGEDAIERCKSWRLFSLLGRSAGVYLRTRRFPYELLPLLGDAEVPLQEEGRDTLSRLQRSGVRRALCEDLPAARASEDIWSLGQRMLQRLHVFRRRRAVGMEGQRFFAERYSIGDVDWLPSAEALGPDALREHVLVWHPPMVPPPREAFARVAEELARSAKHPLASAISSRCARALWVVEQKDEADRRHDCLVYPAPCNWCGHFTELSCDGVPASSTSRGWLCEFRVCPLCHSLYERCRLCCRWTGLPARAGEDAIERCQESAVALGQIAQEYLRSGRFPYEWQPLVKEGLRVRHGGLGRLADQRSLAVRRALCEARQRRHPWRPNAESDSESE